MLTLSPQIARRLLVGLGIAAAVIAIAAAFWLSTTISRGLGRAVAVAREVARGNLEVDAKTKSRDEIGVLLGAMDRHGRRPEGHEPRRRSRSPRAT